MSLYRLLYAISPFEISASAHQSRLKLGFAQRKKAEAFSRPCV